MKSRVVVLLLAIFVSLPANATASAGYYPTAVGEVLQIQGCVSAKAKSPLVIYLLDTNSKSIQIKQINSLSKYQGKCDKGEIAYQTPWRVDRRGDFALYVRDIKSKKSYPTWPDGIESK